MHIQVRLGEPYWRAAGGRIVELEIEDGARVRDLLDALRECWPALSRDLDEAYPICFVGEVQAEVNTTLAEGCQVHLIWPVSGG